QGDDFDFEDQDLNQAYTYWERGSINNEAPTQRATVAGRLQREKIKAQALVSTNKHQDFLLFDLT
ncbi:hypothetical protein PSTT_15211, partial [Puccinia striiformis]